MKNLGIQTFIEKAFIIHNNIYDYNNSYYVNNRTKISITCAKHGEFLQLPGAHLKGQGCPLCFKETRGLSKLTSFDDFVKKANNVHNNSFTYYKDTYKSSHFKTKIQCNNCNNIFYQKVYKHLQGNSCKCNKKVGYSKTNWISFCKKNNKTPIIYIIKCFNTSEEFIKIGRTSNSIKQRFNKHFPYSYTIIKEIYGTPEEIYNKEINLHREFKNYKYIPNINFNGKTECFDIKILDFI
jgi:hypothetical protein